MSTCSVPGTSRLAGVIVQSTGPRQRSTRTLGRPGRSSPAPRRERGPPAPPAPTLDRRPGANAASYACGVSEADTRAARDDEVPAFRGAAHALVDGVADHLAALPSRPVWQPLPDALRSELLDLPLPEHPIALDDVVETA